MTDVKKIAVLMTCHNRKKKTMSCLESLFKASLSADYELSVFLVDDGSVDGTSDAVSGMYPEVTIIEGDGSLFWNRGMLLAWKSACNHQAYDFYLWLNDDVLLHDTSIDSLLQGAKKYPDSIICGAMCSAKNKTVTYGACDSYGKLLTPNGSFQRSNGPLNGNLLLVPKFVYEKVGMLDEKFIHAIGDNDYAYRAHKMGVPVYLVPNYSGICERHEQLPTWCLHHVKFSDRLKALYSPLGCHPYYFFIFERRHFGIGTALKHYVTIHLRVVFPKLWK